MRYHGASASLRSKIEREGLRCGGCIYLTRSLARAEHYATGAACFLAIQRSIRPVGLVVVAEVADDVVRPDRLDARWDPTSRSVVVDHVAPDELVELRVIDFAHLSEREIEAAARWRARRLQDAQRMIDLHGGQEQFADVLDEKLTRLREAWAPR